MIRFKQKEFFLGAALNVAGAVGTVAGLKQGADAAKQQERIAEQQRESDEKTRQALNRVAATGDPQKQMAASYVMAQQKGFANVGQNLMGLGKDLWKTQKGNIKTAAGLAAGLAVTDYMGNRIATSIKNHDEGEDKKNKSFLKKAALGAAAVGGGVLAARHGLMGNSVKKFMTTGRGGQATRFLKKAANPIERDEKTGKINAMGTLMKTGMVALPTVTYKLKKRSQENMIKNQQAEENGEPPRKKKTSFLKKAAIGTAAVGGAYFGAKKGLFGGKVAGYLNKNKGQVAEAAASAVKTPVNKTIGENITSGINKAAGMFGMYGKSGTAGVQNTVNKLANSNNEYSKKVGNYFTKHRSQANLAAAVGTLGAGIGIAKVGKDIIEKPMKKFDKDAYKMSDEQQEQIKDHD